MWRAEERSCFLDSWENIGAVYAREKSSSEHGGRSRLSEPRGREINSLLSEETRHRLRYEDVLGWDLSTYWIHKIAQKQKKQARGFVRAFAVENRRGLLTPYLQPIQIYKKSENKYIYTSAQQGDYAGDNWKCCSPSIRQRFPLLFRCILDLFYPHVIV